MLDYAVPQLGWNTSKVKVCNGWITLNMQMDLTPGHMFLMANISVTYFVFLKVQNKKFIQ